MTLPVKVGSGAGEHLLCFQLCAALHHGIEPRRPTDPPKAGSQHFGDNKMGLFWYGELLRVRLKHQAQLFSQDAIFVMPGAHNVRNSGPERER